MYRQMPENVMHGHDSCMKVTSFLTEGSQQMSEIMAAYANL
jgi:hypothetical protein